MLVLRKVVLAHEEVYNRGDIISGDTSHLGMLERREETITIDSLFEKIKETLTAQITKDVITSLRNEANKKAA